MPVQVRQVAGTRVPVTVIEGLDHDCAVRHLGHDLSAGSAFDSSAALVIDLSDVPDISVETMAALDDAARAWRRDRRWLAVAGLPTARGAGVLAGQRFLSVPAAVAGAQRFFRLVAGYASPRDRAAAVLGASLGVAEAAASATVSVASWVGLALPRRIGRVVRSGRRHG